MECKDRQGTSYVGRNSLAYCVYGLLPICKIKHLINRDKLALVYPACSRGYFPSGLDEPVARIVLIALPACMAFAIVRFSIRRFNLWCHLSCLSSQLVVYRLSCAVVFVQCGLAGKPHPGRRSPRRSGPVYWPVPPWPCYVPGEPRQPGFNDSKDRLYPPPDLPPPGRRECPGYAHNSHRVY